MNVLIIDDSRTMRRVVRRCLVESGHDALQIVEASNGREALAVMEEQLPDLVICDWAMPVMDGITLLKEVRRLDYRLRFGFLTSTATAENWRQASRLGAEFMLAKPVLTEDLCRLLRADATDAPVPS
jgi:two-component system chemotaxis response regulator CheY